MKFIGAIAFVGSIERADADRHTNVMEFRLSVDWFNSVTEYFRQMVMAGDYDGREILVSIYRYDGDREEIEFPDDWHYDTEMLDCYRIVNRFYSRS